MPKHHDTSRWASVTNAFFAGPPACDSHSETSTQGSSQVKKTLTIGLVSEAGDGPIKTLYNESRTMVKKSVERHTKTMFESKLDQHKNLANYSLRMAESERFSKILSLYAQRMDEKPMSWIVGNSECQSYGMTHLEDIADKFFKDIVHYEGDWTKLRPLMVSSTLEARSDMVIRIIAGWGSTAFLDWMVMRECNIEKRFGFRREKHDSYVVQASNMLGKTPRKEVPPTPRQLWEDPRTYFDPKVSMSLEEPAALRCDSVLETESGKKLAKQNDKKSEDANDKEADETKDKKSDGENDRKMGTKVGKKKSKVSKTKGKRKAKKNGKETVEQIDEKITETLIESTQEITDQKDRNKNQTPDTFTEAIMDGEEGKKDEQKYDALGQCTRMISKLDHFLRKIQLAKEEAHAISTSNATPDWPLAKTHQVTVELHGVVITTWTKLPENIQQDLLDLNYIKDEVVALESVIRCERDRIRETFMIWCNAGPRVWAFGCAHQFDMPILRSYEYHRTTVLASCHVAMDMDIRVHKFFNSTKGKQHRSPELEAALAGVDKEQVWKRFFENFRDLCKSVDEMINEVTTAGEHWGGVDKIPMQQWFRWTEPSMEEPDAKRLQAGTGFGKFVFTS
ncbi:hypothetical protein N7G274_006185 [Stereocaulon virgatum]|uniref:Uncharacterized protein n=1 Tax=Stereocaulon virgatum TaxID=373712 RepID=A0ABR4A5Z1_9LECA